MQNFLGYLISIGLLMAPSVVLSDSHLESSVKFQSGENYAGCVYGPEGANEHKWERAGSSGTLHFFREEKCGTGWEGRGLFQVIVDDQIYFDLQKAYNCCVYNDDPRSKLCDDPSTAGKASAWTVSWGQCAEYLDTMWGNSPDGILQEEANVAAEYACEKAISEVPDAYKDFLLSSKTHGRLDKVLEFCKMPVVLSRAIPHMFDFLRDNTGCLWNSPDDNFCAGSRRNFRLGAEFGWDWKVTE
jgi:hypothetical protein